MAIINKQQADALISEQGFSGSYLPERPFYCAVLIFRQRIP